MTARGVHCRHANNPAQTRCSSTRFWILKPASSEPLSFPPNRRWLVASPKWKGTPPLRTLLSDTLETSFPWCFSRPGGGADLAGNPGGQEGLQSHSHLFTKV